MNTGIRRCSALGAPPSSEKPRRPAFARIFMCALLVFAAVCAASTTASAAVVVSITNLSAGELVNRGSYYEMSLPASTGVVSFDVSIAGAEYGSGLIFRTLIGDAANHPVSLVSPSRVSVLDAGANPVTFSMSPNPTGEAQVGDVMLSLIYETTGASLGNVRIQVTRGSGAAAASGIELGPASQAAGSGEAAELSVIQSETVMPEIRIDGNSATLTYKNPAAVSWGGAAPDITLVIGDITQLQKDTPVRIPGWNSGTAVYDVVLPPQQINAILSAKADDIASNIISGITYQEDPENTDTDFQMLALVPTERVVLPEFTTVEPVDEAFMATVENSLDLVADTMELITRIPNDILLDIKVFYMGVEAGDFAIVRIPISDEQLFPLLHLALQQGIVLPGGDGEARWTPTGSGGVDIGGLNQSYDPAGYDYLQIMGPNAAFRTSVPNGAITNSPVTLVFPSDIDYEVLLENEPVEYLTGQALSENGRYTVIARARIEDEQATQEAQAELGDLTGVLELLKFEKTCRFSFRIITKPVSGLLCYNAPPGFVVSAASVNGNEIKLISDHFVFVDANGDYEVETASENDPSVTMTARFTVNNTTPAVELIGASNGIATYGSVELVPAANVEKLTVLKDSQPYSPYANMIDEPGTYRITAADSAGNRSHYEFRVLYSLNMSGWTSFILLILLVGGVGGYLYYVRTHMKVR